MMDSGIEPAPANFTPLSTSADSLPAPAGWRWVKLTPDLAKLESGHTPSRSHPEWWGGDIPWIALPDIRALDGKTAFETAESTNPDGIANSAARVLPAGTVVLSRTASVGYVTVMGRPMATSQDFVNWVCGPELEPWFLAYLLMASRSYIRSLASGSVHKTVYVPTVESFHVCTPDRREQKRIVALLDKQLAIARKIQLAAQQRLDAANALQGVLLRSTFRAPAGPRHQAPAE